jgi:hypothetical protein
MNIRKSRPCRPSCAALEDRRLLSVTLAGSRPTAAPVGVPVVWTAAAAGHGASPVYQFRVRPAGGEARVVQDFSPSHRLTWNPLLEGRYAVEVTVKNSVDAPAGETARVTQLARSRVAGPGSAAVISRTANPLVALYSAGAAPGGSVYVQFRPQGSAGPWTATAPREVVPGRSTNILVAGLRPNTTYLMRHVRNDGTASAPRAFRTGGLPAGLTFPTFRVERGPDAGTDPARGLVYHVGINAPAGHVNTVATDLAGDVAWYYDPAANGFLSYSPTLVPGGTALLIGDDQDGVGGANTLREVDLAGNTLRETNVGAINAQLAARGLAPVLNFHHDALRLPDGRTAVLSSSERTIDVAGTPTRYVGDMVLVLDRDFALAWAWDAFAWLDTSRLPTQGEGPGDWMHSNAIALSPADGNLIVSVRSQDWVIKVNYAGGAGDGRVLWRLGRDGDFALDPADPAGWFTHQHDAVYVNDSTIVLYDNGNTRRSEDPDAGSRGQQYVLDEQAMRATLTLNADLGHYAPAVGSAQRLADGNFVFTDGFARRTIAVRPDGSTAYVQRMDQRGFEYRSYLYDTLYGDPSDLLDPGFEDGATGSAWAFAGAAGVEAAEGAPQGRRVAVLGDSGTIAQQVDLLAGGTYQVRVQAARAGAPTEGAGLVAVRVDGTTVGTFSPAAGGYRAYATAAFDLPAGGHILTFVGLDPAGTGLAALLDSVQIVGAAPTEADAPRRVDLRPAFNRTGIAADGAALASGLDGFGSALPAGQVGTNVVAGGTGYTIGAAGGPNAVGAAGQVIALPGGRHGALRLLATGVNGAQAGQAFVVTYADGTRSTFRRSLSDWAFPGRFAGETTALTTSYRNAAAGTRQAGAFRLAQYSLPLDPGKAVRSLTLPNNPNVVVLAATLVPAGRG